MLDIDLLGNPNIIHESERRRFKEVSSWRRSYRYTEDGVSVTLSPTLFLSLSLLFQLLKI